MSAPPRAGIVNSLLHEMDGRLDSGLPEDR